MRGGRERERAALGPGERAVAHPRLIHGAEAAALPRSLPPPPPLPARAPRPLPRPCCINFLCGAPRGRAPRAGSSRPRAPPHNALRFLRAALRAPPCAAPAEPRAAGPAGRARGGRGVCVCVRECVYVYVYVCECVCGGGSAVARPPPYGSPRPPRPHGRPVPAVRPPSAPRGRGRRRRCSGRVWCPTSLYFSFTHFTSGLFP